MAVTIGVGRRADCAKLAREATAVHNNTMRIRNREDFMGGRFLCIRGRGILHGNRMYENGADRRTTVAEPFGFARQRSKTAWLPVAAYCMILAKHHNAASFAANQLK
jgi:hypothetical protein